MKMSPTELTRCDGSTTRVGASLTDTFRGANAYLPHPLALLRARRERPRCRTVEQRDELAPFHSITSSASDRTLSENLTPSAFAVLRLITNSNLLDCMTGKSAGFAPLRILPT